MEEPQEDEVELFLTNDHLNRDSRPNKKMSPKNRQKFRPVVRTTKSRLQYSPKIESPQTWKYSSREIRRETDITGAPKPLWATLPESTSTLPLSPRAAATRDLEELANSFGTQTNSGTERHHRFKGSGNSLPEGFICLLFLPDFRFPPNVKRCIGTVCRLSALCFDTERNKGVFFLFFWSYMIDAYCPS